MDILKMVAEESDATRLTPEQHLMCGILEKAVEDYVTKPIHRTRDWWAKATDKQKNGVVIREQNRRTRKSEAWHWIFQANNPDYLFSFENICLFLGWESECVRKRIQQQEQDLIDSISDKQDGNNNNSVRVA